VEDDMHALDFTVTLDTQDIVTFSAHAA